MADSINPSHYTKGGVECIEALEAALTKQAFHGFLKGNVIKYLWRYEDKNGLEDLRKAQWYLNRLIDEQAPVQAKEASYDPDDYMQGSGCTDGFCPMPGVRQGPPESGVIFQPIN